MWLRKLLFLLGLSLGLNVGLQATAPVKSDGQTLFVTTRSALYSIKP